MKQDESAEVTITRWVNTYADELFIWAKNRVTESAVAEDLVQDTFMAAFRGLASFRAESAPRTWLFSILKRKIADYYKYSV